MKEMCFNELFEKYGQYDDWFRGGYCGGRRCPEWDACKGRKEFDKLPQFPVTDHDAAVAVQRERAFGAFDREDNYY